MAEDSLPPFPAQVAVVIKCAMTPMQSALYNWVKMTGTLRQDPAVVQASRTHREYVTLNNKCMELRKVRSCTSHRRRRRFATRPGRHRCMPPL